MKILREVRDSERMLLLGFEHAVKKEDYDLYAERLKPFVAKMH